MYLIKDIMRLAFSISLNILYTDVDTHLKAEWYNVGLFFLSIRLEEHSFLPGIT